MNDWKMPFGGMIVKKRQYVIGIIVWTLCTYFTLLTIKQFYGKHMLLISFIVFGIGWFATFMWMLLSSNNIKTQVERPRPKFDNPIHEALYDALNDMGKKDKKPDDKLGEV